jgi:cysteine-rich repeat protein
MRIVVAVLAVFVLGGIGGAAVRVPCPDATYLVWESPVQLNLFGFELVSGRLRPQSSCSARASRMVQGPAGPELRLRLRACGGNGAEYRLRASVADDCRSITGTLRRGRPGAGVIPFAARLVGCGDGVVDPARGEDCDGTTCGSARTCVDCRCTPPTTTTTIAPTTTSTTFVPAAVCGNGVRETGEHCDGDDVGDVTCTDRGYPEGGTLRCQMTGAACRFFDTSGCFRCGDGVREGPEECDLNDVGGAVCDAPDETGGIMSCTDDCTLSRQACWRCGNGWVEPGEVCDDGGTESGDGCSSMCDRECGDGVLNPGSEECDDGAKVSHDGCSASCRGEFNYPGGGGETADSCDLTWDVSAAVTFQPRRQVAVTESADELSIVCSDGDAVCDRGGMAGVCSFDLYGCVEQATRFAVGDTAVCYPQQTVRLDVLEQTTVPVAAVLDAFEVAWRRLGVDDVLRDETSLQPTGDRYGLTCAALSLDVPAGESRTVAVEVTTVEARHDVDVVTVTCLPASP